MIKFKEFNLRERAEIVALAQECSKSLSAQPLIDYFHKQYRTRFHNGRTIVDTIIDKYYPNCNDTFRENIHDILIDYTFAFEGSISAETSKEDLRELFRDFFIFHNDANKNTVAVDEYFDQWYDSLFGFPKKKDDEHAT